MSCREWLFWLISVELGCGAVRRSLFTVLQSNIWKALLGHHAHSVDWFCGILVSTEVVLLFTNRDCSLTALLGGKTLLWHQV